MGGQASWGAIVVAVAHLRAARMRARVMSMTLLGLAEPDPAGTNAAASVRMTATAKRTLTVAADFDRLDAELGRWLRARSTKRAMRTQDESAMDDVAMALRKVRASLSFAAAPTTSNDASVVALVTRAYRWAIRMARELEAIEQLSLDSTAEWARFEAFAPFALAFFDSMVAAPLTAATPTADVVQVERAIDALLAPLVTAMRTSALAA